MQGPDERKVESELVQLLEFEHFALIKELLNNRLKIVWCTRLNRAQDDEEKARIAAEMSGALLCL